MSETSVPAGTTVQTSPKAEACARCGAQIADGYVPVAGRASFCSSCRTLVEAWPYPQWLRLSLVGLLVLLGVALIHGEKYFRAGRMMYKGERLVQEKRYSEALPYLKETLKIGQCLAVAFFLHQPLALVHHAARAEIFLAVNKRNPQQYQQPHEAESEPLRIGPRFHECSAGRTERSTSSHRDITVGNLRTTPCTGLGFRRSLDSRACGDRGLAHSRPPWRTTAKKED